MDIVFHHHYYLDGPVQAALDDIRRKLNLLLKEDAKIMNAIDQLQLDVSAEDTEIDSAVVLLNGIPALIANAGVDPVKLAALRSDIASRTQSLAAAIVAGTPSAGSVATVPTAPVVVVADPSTTGNGGVTQAQPGVTQATALNQPLPNSPPSK